MQTSSVDEIVSSNNVNVLANIIEIIPYVIRNISESKDSKDLLTNDYNNATIRSIAANKIAAEFASKGLV